MEVDEADGEDLVAEQLRDKQEKLHSLQLQADQANLQLQQAQLRFDQ